MKNNRVIFYLIFALFHIGALIFTIQLGNSSSFLMSVFSWVPYFKWVTLLGVVLVIIDFTWAIASARESKRERAILSQEVNTLKAKMFDLQEQMSKTSSTQRPINPPAQP
ncbi:MAG: hypothetical protein WA874_18420 [Chryseosolibacter sp.]